MVVRRAPSLALALLIFAAAGCATVGKNAPGIDNFAEVDPGVLYRGAQPTEKGIRYLADRGVKTVVNLRDDAPEWEKGAVEQAGMRYVWIPSVASEADPKVVERFLVTMRDGAGPVFVHCKAGRDRT